MRKVTAFLVSLVLIVLVFPHQVKFKYDFYQLKGKPWNYPDLVAPFDFAISKSADQLNAEKEEVRATAKNYFKTDKQVYPGKKKELNLALEKQLTSKSSSLKNQMMQVCNALIDSLYKKGIIQLGEGFENKPADYDIFLLNENLAEEHQLNDFFTVQTADDFIKSKLSLHSGVEYSTLIPIMENAIAQTIFFDKEESAKDLNQDLQNISPTHGGYVKDQTVILKGELVDTEKFLALESLKKEYDKQSGANSGIVAVLIGQVLVVSLCLLVLAIFLLLFRKDIFLDNAKLLFILFLIVLMVTLANVSVSYEKINLYILPFCIIPIIIRAFFDTRLALFAHIVTTLLIAFIAENRFEFVFVQLVAGMVSIFSVIHLRNRSQFFLAATLVFAAYLLAYSGINLMQEGSFTGISLNATTCFAFSALLTSFAYPLIYIFEKSFGFLSDVSLMELSDTNNPLLRELALKAPGTFQHSLQVSNIAEEIIFQIGGDALLVRTGALYHDIGKMTAPAYFIENQTAGNNPHDQLSYEESAKIIISHVACGTELAKKNKLPRQIINFIQTHHGTTSTAYFYRMYQHKHPDEKIDPERFRYSGPLPFSRETAVLMMADTVEAASRSLKTYTEQSISDLVENCMANQIDLHQFDDSDITFRDIHRIKEILKKKLNSIYHLRVEYPTN